MRSYRGCSSFAIQSLTSGFYDLNAQKFAENNVKHVIKACPEVTYDAGRLAAAGIEHHVSDCAPSYDSCFVSDPHQTLHVPRT